MLLLLQNNEIFMHNVICNRCSAFESNEETPGWIAGAAVGYCLPCKHEDGIEVKTIIIITLSGIVAHLTGPNGEFGGLKCIFAR